SKSRPSAGRSLAGCASRASFTIPTSSSSTRTGGTQSQSAERALEEFVQGVPGISVGAEEEVASASLVTKAVEIVFRTVMLDHKWACVGNNTFVDAAFAGTDERKNVGAFNLRVQSEMDDGFVLLVSPEVLRFSRYKVTDFVSSEVLESFYNGVCKLLPDEENFERPEVIWSLKHGLALNSEYFISVQLAYGSYEIKWLPSAYILQGPGFSQAYILLGSFSPASRSVKAVDVIDSFMKIFGAWDFFSQGQLKVKACSEFPTVIDFSSCPPQSTSCFSSPATLLHYLTSLLEVSSLGIITKIPVWTMPTNKFPFCMARNKENADIQNSLSPKHLISRDLKLALGLDFRTPKPGIQFVHGSRTLDLNNVKQTVTCRSNLNISTEYIQNDVNACSTSDTLPAVMKGPPGRISASKIMCTAVQSTVSATTELSILLWFFLKLGPVNGSYFAEVKHSSAEYDQSVDPSQRLKASKRKKEKTKAFLGSNVSENSGKEVLIETFRRKPENSEKNKHNLLKELSVILNFHFRVPGSNFIEDIARGSKMRAKQCVDQSVITTKVEIWKIRGELQSLTMVDLKCFLKSKKAKVGGKKEELIKRVTSLLA
ncbi:unnamed protein product, partial [Musa textilis]